MMPTRSQSPFDSPGKQFDPQQHRGQKIMLYSNGGQRLMEWWETDLPQSEWTDDMRRKMAAWQRA